jgi:hypothetical protein
MKIAGKIIKIIGGIVIVLLILIVAGFYIFGERALKVGVEVAATKALGVGVTIDDVALSLLRGSVGIDGLIVNNPPGYEYDNLLELNSTKVKVKVGELLGETAHIKDIKLDGINLVIEQKGLTNNLNTIIKSMPKEEKQAAEPSGKKLQIDNLEITNTKVKVKLLPVPGKVDTIPLELATIKMTNLGGDNKLSTAKLVSKILAAIAKGVAEQGAGILPADLINSMSSTLQSSLGITVELGKGVLKEAEKAAETGKDVLKEGEKILDTGTDKGKEVIEGFKGLLKPKKKE